MEHDSTAMLLPQTSLGEVREGVRFTDPTTWSQLTQAEGLLEFGAAWLALQCGLIGSVKRAVVVLRQEPHGGFKPLCFWPHGSDVCPAIDAVAELALEQQRGAVRQQTLASGEPVVAVGYPLIFENCLYGVVALTVPPSADNDLQLTMRLLQWGCAWWEPRLHAASQASSGLAATLTLLTHTMEQPRFNGAATAVATEVASLFDCELVAYGVRKGRHAQVRALSHSAQFSRKSALVQSLGNAMDEAIDQQDVVSVPQREQPSLLLTRANEALRDERGAAAVCTVPLGDGERLVGALTLVREQGAPFTSEETELCAHVALLVGPLLDGKRREDRWIGRKVGESVHRGLAQLFGWGQLGLKLSLLSLVGLVTFLSLASGMFRVSAPAVLEGTIQRVVTAPQDGYVAKAERRAGDLVREGQVLAVLEDKELALDKLKWEGERAKFLREYSRALAAKERSKVRILAAQIEQAEARIALFDAQLARTRIVAPFDGVVVFGDLSQALGAPVSRGDALFQVAPLDSYRVMLKVDERDVYELDVGQLGVVALAGLPGESLNVRVEKITPVAGVEQGRNVFQVEARLLAGHSALRPGMEGIAKVDVEERKLVWIWTHRMFHWVRLWWWSWSP